MVTHPWITFQANLQRLNASTWVMLGECQSKCEHLAGTPLEPATAEKLYAIYLAKGVAATTAIEGNTLSEKEVQDRIQGRLQLPPSQEYLGQEVDNIVQACRELAPKTCAPGAAGRFSADDIKDYNRMVLRNLPIGDGGVAGEVSSHMVVVGRYRGAPREDCEYLLERLCQWLNGPWPDMNGELLIGSAVLKAVLAHLYLAWIHPFADGNGRTARLLEYCILLAHNVPAPAAHLLSNHYNKTRTEYYRQLAYASESKGDILSWIDYAVGGFRDGLRQQIQFVKDQQYEVVWRDYVHSKFQGRKNPAAHRQRDLVLNMPPNDWTTFSQLTRTNPDVAREYATKTDRTLIRDLKSLLEMGLIQRSDKSGYRPNRDVIRAFLPLRRAI